jgi:hypothetical protein
MTRPRPPGPRGLPLPPVSSAFSAPRDDVSIIDENECRRMERALDDREKLVKMLAAQGGRRPFPKRYVFELRFDVDAGLEQNLTQTVVVDRDIKFFRARRVTYSVLAVGDISGAANVSQATLPPAAAVEGTFVFEWSLRDSHTDRLWTNVPMPSTFIGNALLGETVLSRPAHLPPGTTLELTVRPLVLAAQFVVDPDSSSPIPLVENVRQYTLFVSVIGDEEFA